MASGILAEREMNWRHDAVFLQISGESSQVITFSMYTNSGFCLGWVGSMKNVQRFFRRGFIVGPAVRGQPVSSKAAAKVPNFRLMGMTLGCLRVARQ